MLSHVVRHCDDHDDRPSIRRDHVTSTLHAAPPANEHSILRRTVATDSTPAWHARPTFSRRRTTLRGHIGLGAPRQSELWPVRNEKPQL